MITAKSNMAKKRSLKPVKKTEKKATPVIRHFERKKSKIDYAKIKLFAEANFSDNKIIQGLGINKKTFIKQKADPKVQEILKEARKNISDNKNKGGAPVTYEPRYCKEMLDYFSVKPYEYKQTDVFNKKGEKTGTTEYLDANDLPLFSGFAVKIGVHRSTLINWAKEYPEFEEIYKICKDMQDTNLLTNGLRGLYNPSYAGLVSKNWLNMKDKKDVTTNNQPLKANTYVVPAFNNSFNEPDDPDGGE